MPELEGTPLPPEYPSSISETPAHPEIALVAYPLRSEESFEAYFQEIQSRLAAHAARRVNFLHAAYERLGHMLQAARDVEDTALVAELEAHHTAAQQLLNALPHPDGESFSQTELSNASYSFSTPNGHRMSQRTDTLPPLNEAGKPTASSVRHLSVSVSGRDSAGEATPRPSARYPRRPVRPLGDIEADATRLRYEVQRAARDWPLTRDTGELNIPNCLRMRSLACRQRRLEEEGGDTEITEVVELSEDIIELLDSANDQDYTVALDDELDPPPTAYQWGELAERYMEMGRAQEAFEWWHENRAMLTVADVQPLAEAVAAVQQRFNRLLFRIGARDPFQQQLFDDLRTWAREDQCYLFSLRPKVPMIELIEKAGTLEASWEHARIPVAEEQHRQKLIDGLIDLVLDPEFGTMPEQDEERLREALLECKASRIPVSDRRLRDALLPWGVFLEEDERFRDYTREINLEWERRQEMGQSDEEIDPDPEVDPEMLAALRALTRGHRCLFLGGIAEEEARQKIQETLELAELVWPSTKPSDTLDKYHDEWQHAEIVVLITRFSRKEWKEAEANREREGKRLVSIVTANRMSQLVRDWTRSISPESVVHS